MEGFQVLSSMPAPGWVRSVRGLYLVAMAVFIVTVVIGILNGLDLVEFNHDQILTHVHSGTIGWISLSIVAATAWLVRGIDARLATALAVLVPIYVAAFYLGNPMLRAVSGGLLLVAILWLVVWAWRASAANGTLPALAIALGLTTFAYGAVIGVLRQIQLANGPSFFPSGGDVVGAHAAAMVFSYLILVAMGLIEWRLRGTTDRPRGGLAQVILLFAGGLIISLTLLFLSDDSAIQAAGGLYLLVELIAVSIFAVRILAVAVRIDWMAASGERYLATSAVFVVVATAIFLYVIFQFISDPGIAADPGPIIGVLTASDHAAFIGVITNLMFGLLVILTRDQGDRWPWAGQLVYWGVNIGLVVFLVGLIGNIAIAKLVGAPVMGVAILLGLATFGLRLWTSNLLEAEEG